MNLQVFLQLFEIFFNLQIQKRIVVTTTIHGNSFFLHVVIANLSSILPFLLFFIISDITLIQ